MIAPWTSALNQDQKSDLWNKIKTNLQSEDISYQIEIMFGSKKYPAWGGYSLGYDIVQKALANDKKLKSDIWTNMSSDKILKLSKYK